MMSDEMNGMNQNDMNNTANDAAQNEVPNSSMNVGSSGSNTANNSWNGNSDSAGQNYGSGNYSSGSDNGQSGYGYSESGQGQYQGTTGNGNYQYSSAYGSNPTPGGKKPKQKKPHKKFGTGAKIAVAVVLAAAVGAGAGFGTYSFQSRVNGSESSGTEATLKIAQADENSSDSSSADTTSEESSSSSSSVQATLIKSSDTTQTVSDVSDIADEVMPSIVSVYNKYTATAEFWGQTYSQEEEASGSGIIIGQTDTELLIVTNNHVVANADELSVQFIDNTTATANIKGTDSANDLAVIAVSLDDIKDDTMSQIKVATIGDSDSLRVGEPAIAIGNALGYGQSVTTGVISALNREITDENGETNTFIQTDAAINPGNSGGALLNSKGEVIGINSSKIASENVEGMGYAIPMARAIPIIENLMNQETKTKVDEADQGYLGISGVSVTAQIGSAYGMPEGVYIAEIIDGGGAADSDLQKGDIITKIDGTTVTSMDDLKKELTYYAAGNTVTLTVERASGNGNYDEKEIKVTLGDKSTIENSDSNSSSDSKSGSSSGSGNSESGSDNSGSNNSGNGSSGEEGGENGFGQEENPFGFFFGENGQ